MQASRSVRRQRMIARGDDPNVAMERIIIDDSKFDPKFINGIDYTIDSENQSIRDIALEVYEKYAKKVVMSN